jgi:hypothetical protein
VVTGTVGVLALLAGVLLSNPLAISTAGRPAAAESLASSFGEFFVPVSGQRRDRVSEPATVDGRPGWMAGYRVVPDAAGVDPADIAVTVVEDGEHLVYALTIVQPADPGLRSEAAATVAAIRFA